MIVSVVWQRGFHLPEFNLAAFDSDHLKFTLGGFARILALMTGIEIFANLVAAYEGSAVERSRKAFGSLLIVMGTTVITMIIVGPAIFQIADPTLHDRSVFTQTMDALLPAWLSYLGTLIGIAVLLSAAAASTQGVQNLALGLRARHYIPANWGKKNKHDVPSFPSWCLITVVALLFVFCGTHEETYLALYAAGVFILLSMTGWSSTKRFLRQFRQDRRTSQLLGLLVSIFAATCATFATAVIFEERFKDGAWSYCILVPMLYLVFDFFRKKLGNPPESIDERLTYRLRSVSLNSNESPLKIQYRIDKILVPMSGSLGSDVAFHAALKWSAHFGSEIYPIHVSPTASSDVARSKYFLNQLQYQWPKESFPIYPKFLSGDVDELIVKECESNSYDLICLATKGMKRINPLTATPLIYKIIFATTPPVLIFRPNDRWESRATEFRNILVPLDGSSVAEQVLPYVSAIANQFSSKVTLISVPESAEDPEVLKKLENYLKFVRQSFFDPSISVSVTVEGSGPGRTIIHHAQTHAIDLIAMVSHGRGGLK
ncbi:MAG: universal stress protein, partial [Proteobacteria bacterium]